MYSPYEPQSQSSSLNDFVFDDSAVASGGGVSLHSSAPWQGNEDYDLCYIWAHYSEDSVRGNDQSGKVFWQKVMDSFNKRHPQKTRSLSAISGRFMKISRQTQFFGSQVYKIKQANPSGIGGTSDLYQRANKMFFESFQPENKHQPHYYQFMNCYELLSSHPKWNSENTKTVEAMQSKNKDKGKGRKKSQKSNLSDSPGESYGSASYNYDEDNEEDVNVLPVDEDARPMGVKAAKKKNMRNVGTDERLAASRERYAQENEERRITAEKKIAVMSRFADLEQQRVTLEQSKHEFQMRQQDYNIMQMDVSGMDEVTAAYWIEMKRQILSRTSRGP